MPHIPPTHLNVLPLLPPSTERIPVLRSGYDDIALLQELKVCRSFSRELHHSFTEAFTQSLGPISESQRNNLVFSRAEQGGVQINGGVK